MNSRSGNKNLRKTKSDPYRVFIDDNWEIIERAFKEHKQIGPVVVVDVTDSKILAYKGTEFLEILSVRTWQTTKDVFAQTIAKGGIMVFIRDSTNRKLSSYVFTKR